MAEKRISVRLAAVGGRQVRADLEGIGQAGTKGKGRAHVQADHRAGDDAQLTPKAPDKIPDLPAFECLGCVYSCWAVWAVGSTGCAVAVAPAELPLGKGDEAFFSASSSMARATYWV